MTRKTSVLRNQGSLALMFVLIFHCSPFSTQAQLSVGESSELRGCCNMVLLCEGRLDQKMDKENVTLEECKAATFNARPRCPHEIDKRFTAGASCSSLPEFTGTWGDGNTGPETAPEPSEATESTEAIDCAPGDYDQAIWKAPPQAEVKKVLPNGDALDEPLCIGTARVFTAEGEECNPTSKRFTLCCSAKRQVIDQLDLVYHVCPTATECMRQEPMPFGCDEWFRNYR